MSSNEGCLDYVSLAPLPEPNADLSGTSTKSNKNCKVVVSNRNGYLCHVQLDATFEVTPDVLFALFTCPDNSRIFRDIKGVGDRKVITIEPGLKTVEVETLGELKVMFLKRPYSTFLRVAEDSRNPEALSIDFQLVKSDVLERFGGNWQLCPLKDSVGKIVGTKATLHQDVLPKGLPPVLQRVPVLGSLMRNVGMRAVWRIVEDLEAACDKIKHGQKSGRKVGDVLREVCGIFSEEGYANGQVTSFAFDISDCTSESEEGAEGKEEQEEILDDGRTDCEEVMGGSESDLEIARPSKDFLKTVEKKFGEMVFEVKGAMNTAERTVIDKCNIA